MGINQTAKHNTKLHISNYTAFPTIIAGNLTIITRREMKHLCSHLPYISCLPVMLSVYLFPRDHGSSMEVTALPKPHDQQVS